MPALRKLARRNKRSATAEVEIAIENHLRQAGVEVPPEEE